jgi:maltooligosyltrehalose trehalohydrolase
MLGPAAVVARWRMGDGMTLAIALNLADTALTLAPGAVPVAPDASVLFETDGVLASLTQGALPAASLAAWLEGAQG